MQTLIHTGLALLLLSMTASAAAAERLVDPTRPATMKAVVAAETTGVRVEAIMNSAGHPLAIVNGKVVRAGDSVGTVQIEEILSDGVRFKRDGRSQIARVGKQMIEVRHNVTSHGDAT